MLGADVVVPQHPRLFLRLVKHPFHYACESGLVYQSKHPNRMFSRYESMPERPAHDVRASTSLS